MTLLEKSKRIEEVVFIVKDVISQIKIDGYSIHVDTNYFSEDASRGLILISVDDREFNKLDENMQSSILCQLSLLVDDFKFKIGDDSFILDSFIDRMMVYVSDDERRRYLKEFYNVNS